MVNDPILNLLREKRKYIYIWMTIFSSAYHQACYFIFIYSDLMLGAPCIRRSLKMIWIAGVDMPDLDAVPLRVRWGHWGLRMSCFFLVTHSQSKPEVRAALAVNLVKHLGIWLLSQNVPGPSVRTLQVIAPGCLPKDGLENWSGALLFPSYQKLTCQKFADTAMLC